MAVFAPVAAVRIGDEAAKPATVVGSAQGKTVRGTSDQTMRVRVTQRPSVALDGTAGARRGAVDAGIPTKKKKKYIYICKIYGRLCFASY